MFRMESFQFDDNQAWVNILSIVCGLLVFFLYYRKLLNIPKSIKSFNGNGKVIILSGINTEIAQQTALALAKYGVRVILTSEDTKLLKQIHDGILKQYANSDIKCMNLDLNSFASVREFVAEFIRCENRLDYLVNFNSNSRASIKMCDNQLGITMNYTRYNQFLLTALLSPVLKKSQPSRILFMTSVLHQWQISKPSRALYEYGQNSLATILAARVVSDRLRNSGVTCNVVNPGLGWEDWETIFNNLVHLPIFVKQLISSLALTTTESRVNAIVELLLGFSYQNISKTYFNGSTFAQATKQAQNDESAHRIWTNIEETTGMKFENIS